VPVVNTDFATNRQQSSAANSAGQPAIPPAVENFSASAIRRLAGG